MAAVVEAAAAMATEMVSATAATGTAAAAITEMAAAAIMEAEEMAAAAAPETVLLTCLTFTQKFACFSMNITVVSAAQWIYRGYVGQQGCGSTNFQPSALT